MSETKVPPGWVRLRSTTAGREQDFRACAITQIDGNDDLSLSWIYSGVQLIAEVSHSPAEVVALIAAAEAAERRSTVVAVVTSPSQGDAIVAVTADGTCWAPSEGRMQPVIAGIDLDDIERREGE